MSSNSAPTLEEVLRLLGLVDVALAHVYRTYGSLNNAAPAQSPNSVSSSNSTSSLFQNSPNRNTATDILRLRRDILALRNWTIDNQNNIEWLHHRLQQSEQRINQLEVYIASLVSYDSANTQVTVTDYMQRNEECVLPPEDIANDTATAADDSDVLVVPDTPPERQVRFYRRSLPPRMRGRRLAMQTVKARCPACGQERRADGTCCCGDDNNE